MLGYWRPHDNFQNCLVGKLQLLMPGLEPQILFHAKVLEKVYTLNLDPLKDLVANCYSPIGRPAQKQPELFRALVVMTHYSNDGITRFVERLHHDPVLAIACGFEFDSIPGEGTFYDFLHRFWLGEASSKAVQKPDSIRKKKPAADEKLPEKKSGIVAELVEKILAGETWENRPERLLQKILVECAVKPSAKLGLLGNKDDKLVFAADGAPLETGANPYGKKLCQCRDRCSCPRRYSDPTATWGWDSYHERWFYGHTLYCLTAANSLNDLPLMLHLTEGARHDCVSFVKSIPALLSLYPQFEFAKGLLDSAHDAYPIYQLLYHYRIEPFIELN